MSPRTQAPVAKVHIWGGCACARMPLRNLYVLRRSHNLRESPHHLTLIMEWCDFAWVVWSGFATVTDLPFVGIYICALFPLNCRLPAKFDCPRSFNFSFYLLFPYACFSFFPTHPKHRVPRIVHLGHFNPYLHTSNSPNTLSDNWSSSTLRISVYKISLLTFCARFC